MAGGATETGTGIGTGTAGEGRAVGMTGRRCGSHGPLMCVYVCLCLCGGLVPCGCAGEGRGLRHGDGLA